HWLQGRRRYSLCAACASRTGSPRPLFPGRSVPALPRVRCRRQMAVGLGRNGGKAGAPAAVGQTQSLSRLERAQRQIEGSLCSPSRPLSLFVLAGLIEASIDAVPRQRGEWHREYRIIENDACDGTLLAQDALLVVHGAILQPDR